MSQTEKNSVSSDKDKGDAASDVAVAPADQTMDNILERLPSQYRKELLKQYELPETKVSIITCLRYATPLEFGMQIVGAFMAIAAGMSLS